MSIILTREDTGTTVVRDYEMHCTTVTKKVCPHFIGYVKDWYYRTYFSCGGYGSGKSYHTALKLVLKLMQEKRKALVLRNVYDTHRDSTFSLLKEIVYDIGQIGYKYNNRAAQTIDIFQSPMRIVFPNGSEIIFRGCDKIEKLKSLNGVSIVWIEEASEIPYNAYKEIRKRLRTPDVTVHFLLTTNPVGKENWTYQHFFKRTVTDEKGLVKEKTILDDNELYKRRVMVLDGVYYHHSVAKDNLYLKYDYLKELYETKFYDPDLWRVAWLGMYGIKGIKVLPNFTIAENAREFKNIVGRIPKDRHFCGMDFGFEESFNAVIRCAVDEVHNYLYIYSEDAYINNITDDQMAKLPSMQRLRAKNILIHADAAEPKAIQYYRLQGYRMKGAKKFAGSRVAYTRKVKNFAKIICSPVCKNVIRELKTLVYKVDEKTGMIPDYGEFNIDPHTFKCHKLGVYKLLEKLERLKCRPERKSLRDKSA